MVGIFQLEKRIQIFRSATHNLNIKLFPEKLFKSFEKGVQRPDLTTYYEVLKKNAGVAMVI